MKLHLGCGHDYKEGWVNVDGPKDDLCYDDLKADVHAKIENLVYPEGSVSEILMMAVFEHFPRHVAIMQLRKFYNWLEEGGKVTINVPDFFAAVDKMRAAGSPEERLFWWRHIFGPQDTVQFGTHYDGFDEAKLKLIFSTAGFNRFVCTKEGRWPNLRFTAFKDAPFMPEEKARERILSYMALYEAKDESGMAFHAWTEAMGLGKPEKPETPAFKTQRNSLAGRVKDKVTKLRHGL